MKELLYLFSLLMFAACHQAPPILGQWKVNNSFYKATYQIVQADHTIKGQVLHYDDGTSQYHFNGTNPTYLFNNLIKKETVYVDAVTGATTLETTQNVNHITLKNQDTLYVTTYIHDKPLEEVWVRQEVLEE